MDMLIGEHSAVLRGILKAGETHWSLLKGANSLPLKNDLDPINVPRLLANSCLIEVLDGGKDFRYVIIGSQIQFISASGQTGKKVSELPSQKGPSQVIELFTETLQSHLPRYCRLDYVGDDIRVRDVLVGTFPFASKECPDEVSHLWTIVKPNFR